MNEWRGGMRMRTLQPWLWCVLLLGSWGIGHTEPVVVAWPLGGKPLPYAVPGTGLTVRSPSGDPLMAQTRNGLPVTSLSSTTDAVDRYDFDLDVSEDRDVKLSLIYTRVRVSPSLAQQSSLSLDGGNLVTGIEQKAPSKIFAPSTYDLAIGGAEVPDTPMSKINVNSLSPVFSAGTGGSGGEIGTLVMPLVLKKGSHHLTLIDGAWFDNGVGYRTQFHMLKMEISVDPPKLHLLITNLASGPITTNSEAISALIGDPYSLTWTTQDANQVSIVGGRDGFSVPVAALNGTEVFSKGQPSAGDYVYTVSASNLAGTARAQVVVHVGARDILLMQRASNPVASLSPSTQTVLLGESATFTTGGDPNENWSTGAQLAGGGKVLLDPASPISLVPTVAGHFTYTYSTIGYNRLRWRGDGASRYWLHHPDGHVDEVTSLLYVDTITPGDYFVTATDDLGTNGVDSPAVKVLPPAQASASAEVWVNPKIVSLVATPAPVPTASLSPSSQALVLGSSATFALKSDFGRSSELIGDDGFSARDPGSPVSVTPATTGVHHFTYTVHPGPGSVDWSVEGALRTEWDGVAVSAVPLAAEAGSHVLVAFGPDGTRSEKSVLVPATPDAVATASVTVSPRIDSFDGIDPAVPTAVLSASPVDLTLGGASSLAVQTTHSDVWSLQGPAGFQLNQPAAVLAVTPQATGANRYTLTAQPQAGAARWKVAGATRVTFDGVEVSGESLAGVAPGVHELRAFGADGTSSTASISIAARAPAVSTVTLRVAPRIDAFWAENPAAPTASLQPNAVQHVLFGDPVTLTLVATGLGSSVFDGSGIHLLDTTGPVSFTPFNPGLQIYRFTVAPVSTGVLHWTVAGAVSVEIDGQARAGDSWTTAPAGAHTIRALGPDGTETLGGTAAVVIPPSVVAETTVAVHPKISRFEAQNPEPPSLSLSLDPATQLVNPAKATLKWEGSSTSSVEVVATGRGSEWTRTERTGSAAVVLGPGPHTFRASAFRLPSTLSWTISGGESLTLVTPGGKSLDVTSQALPWVATEAGEYQLKVAGRDGLVTESDLQEIAFASPATQRVDATVDVTLTVTSDKEGRGEGGGVKPYGSTASASAVPNRGYHFSHWTGDSTESSSPTLLTMTEDRAVTAHYDPNLYHVNVAVRPSGTGTVEGTGVYPFGSDATVRAVPKTYFRFVGWDASWSGAVNPKAFTVEEDVTAIADFERVKFRLDIQKTGAGSGTVSPAGGLYLSEAELTLQATPDSVSRFIRWSGDLTGTSKTVGLTMLRDFSVTAVFEPKFAQTISFPSPGDQEVNKGTAVKARASSGLAVRYVVVSGRAEMSGGEVFVRGSGAITLRAEQDGDDTYLPANPVEVTFQGYNAPVLRLHEEGADTRVEDTRHQNPNKILSPP